MPSDTELIQALREELAFCRQEGPRELADLLESAAGRLEEFRHAVYLFRITSIYPPNSPRELLEGQLNRLAAVASGVWHDNELPNYDRSLHKATQSSDG